jgi:hypothetical protein
MTEDLKALTDRAVKARTAFYEAKAAAIRAENDCEHLILDRVAAQKAIITQEVMAEHQPKLDALKKAAAAALAIVDAASIAAGQAEIAAMGDVRVVEWETTRFGNNWVLTGRSGRLEVATRETRFSAVRSSSPTVGEILVRINKKDGTPSLLIATGSYRLSWKPLDWKPPA